MMPDTITSVIGNHYAATSNKQRCSLSRAWQALPHHPSFGKTGRRGPSAGSGHRTAHCMHASRGWMGKQAGSQMQRAEMQTDALT